VSEILGPSGEPLSPTQLEKAMKLKDQVETYGRMFLELDNSPLDLDQQKDVVELFLQTKEGDRTIEGKALFATVPDRATGRDRSVMRSLRVTETDGNHNMKQYLVIEDPNKNEVRYVGRFPMEEEQTLIINLNSDVQIYLDNGGFPPGQAGIY